MSLHILNLPREVCHLLIGPDHKTSHRMVVGLVIMAGGVYIAKVGGHFPDTNVMHYVLDMGGYFVHALGSVPYLEYLLAAEE